MSGLSQLDKLPVVKRGAVVEGALVGSEGVRFAVVFEFVIDEFFPQGGEGGLCPVHVVRVLVVFGQHLQPFYFRLGVVDDDGVLPLRSAASS
ncbi:MAG: hypothetical protein IJ679_08265 [Lachnospiraceae bacterium]|nr:hypothetical protein [Lachnospiraceae bacterium]